jgi:hypothetical protein
MKNALLVALVWFAVLAAVPLWASSMGHGISPWFAGYAFIDVVSAVFIGVAIKLAHT